MGQILARRLESLAQTFFIHSLRDSVGAFFCQCGALAPSKPPLHAPAAHTVQDVARNGETSATSTSVRFEQVARLGTGMSHPPVKESIRCKYHHRHGHGRRATLDL